MYTPLLSSLLSYHSTFIICLFKIWNKKLENKVKINHHCALNH
jgi:hypothetical protein